VKLVEQEQDGKETSTIHIKKVGEGIHRGLNVHATKGWQEEVLDLHHD